MIEQIWNSLVEISAARVQPADLLANIQLVPTQGGRGARNAAMLGGRPTAVGPARMPFHFCASEQAVPSRPTLPPSPLFHSHPCIITRIRSLSMAVGCLGQRKAGRLDVGAAEELVVASGGHRGVAGPRAWHA
eukprot:905129-Prymnesium_polylepis.1